MALKAKRLTFFCLNAPVHEKQFDFKSCCRRDRLPENAQRNMSVTKNHGNRVTGLRKFSPIGHLFILGSFLKIYQAAQIPTAVRVMYMHINFDKTRFGRLFSSYIFILTTHGLGDILHSKSYVLT
jgi:hypothetical protein